MSVLPGVWSIRPPQRVAAGPVGFLALAPPAASASAAAAPAVAAAAAAAAPVPAASAAPATAAAANSTAVPASASANSRAPSRALDGLIGPIQPRDLAPEIARAAQEVPVGEVSAPVETSRGWIVIKVEQRQDAETPSFESVRRECEEAVRRVKAGPAYDAYIKKLWKSATIEVRRTYVDRLPSTWRELVAVHD